MRKIMVVLFLMLISVIGRAADTPRALPLSCQDTSWSDVETLVQPYLDDVLYTALVMQGQSANYRTSEAASQAMDDALPEVVKRILQAIIEADC